MQIFRLCSVLSEDSQAQVDEFFQGCPISIHSPLVLELGTVLDDSIPEVNLSATYQVCPLQFAANYNHRTGNPSLVWQLRAFTDNLMSRHLEIGSVVQPLSPVGFAIWLSEYGYSMGRKQRAWFNSKEDTLMALCDANDPLTLTFEGESLVPVDVPATALLPEVRLVNN